MAVIHVYLSLEAQGIPSGIARLIVIKIDVDRSQIFRPILDLFIKRSLCQVTTGSFSLLRAEGVLCFLAYYGGTAFEFNCSNSVETLGNVKHKYHVLGLVRASRQQPFVCGCSKQIAVRHRRTPRNGKWSGTKFTIPTKFPTFPRCMSTAIGFFPVADPRKILSNKKIQDQEAQTLQTAQSQLLDSTGARCNDQIYQCQ